MDLNRAHDFERRLDRLGRSSDPDVKLHYGVALEARRKGDTAGFEAAILEGEKVFVPKEYIIDALVRVGAAVSKAQAKRLVDTHAVRLDGVTVHQDDKDVSRGTELTVAGKAYPLR